MAHSGPVLIAAAHGTGSQEGQRSIAELTQRVSAHLAGVQVVSCFMDVLSPSLAEVLPRYPDAIVVPMLLCTGFHVRVDIPALADPVGAIVAGHLGPAPVVTEILSDLVNGHGDEIALVAAGSRDPAATDELADAADALAHATGRAVTPLIADAHLEQRIDKLNDPVVASYVMAEGFFYDRIRAAARSAWVTAPLAREHRIAGLVCQRYHEAVTTSVNAVVKLSPNLG